MLRVNEVSWRPLVLSSGTLSATEFVLFCSVLFHFILFHFLFFILRGVVTEREGVRESQAGPKVLAQNPTQGSILRTLDHDLSGKQELDGWLS